MNVLILLDTYSRAFPSSSTKKIIRADIFSCAHTYLYTNIPTYTFYLWFRDVTTSFEQSRVMFMTNVSQVAS
jgi:hypothetical protein